MPLAAGVLNALAELPVVGDGCGNPDGEAEGAAVLACDAPGVELPTVAASSAPHAARANDASTTIALTRKEERESVHSSVQVPAESTDDGLPGKAGRRWKRSLKSNEELIVKRLTRKRNTLKYFLSESH